MRGLLAAAVVCGLACSAVVIVTVRATTCSSLAVANCTSGATAACTPTFAATCTSGPCTQMVLSTGQPCWGVNGTCTNATTCDEADFAPLPPVGVPVSGEIRVGPGLCSFVLRKANGCAVGDVDLPVLLANGTACFGRDATDWACCSAVCRPREPPPGDPCDTFTGCLPDCTPVAEVCCPGNECLPTIDFDADGFKDCDDRCPFDVFKVEPGICGCGFSDLDTDGDNLAECEDNCPLIFNPNQTNSDGDSFGDVCDNCVFITNEPQTNSDTDIHGDVCDNCPTLDNDDQADLDGDNLGDTCDGDADGDGLFVGIPFNFFNLPLDDCDDLNAAVGHSMFSPSITTSMVNGTILTWDHVALTEENARPSNCSDYVLLKTTFPESSSRFIADCLFEIQIRINEAFLIDLIFSVAIRVGVDIVEFRRNFTLAPNNPIEILVNGVNVTSTVEAGGLALANGAFIANGPGPFLISWPTDLFGFFQVTVRIDVFNTEVTVTSDGFLFNGTTALLGSWDDDCTNDDQLRDRSDGSITPGDEIFPPPSTDCVLSSATVDGIQAPNWRVLHSIGDDVLFDEPFGSTC